ncbi:MAG TPA: anti-sigma factor, partial [Gemmatimonadota bacterium]|nr:anti-sigma factor [Gemmatimonadota bacterium]
MSAAMAGPHPDEGRLNDFVDGLLPDGRVESVREHLDACGRCREEVEAIRSVVEGAARLPRGVRAPESLWRAVASRTIEAKEESARVLSWRPGRWELAAAAVLLVALSSLLTAVLLRGGAGAGSQGAGLAERPPAAASVGPGALDAGTVLEASYAPSVAALRKEFEARRSGLSPATVRTVERNLEVIDRAIAETRSALASDPGSRPAAHLMAAMYRQEIGMLERT